MMTPQTGRYCLVRLNQVRFSPQYSVFQHAATPASPRLVYSAQRGKIRSECQLRGPAVLMPLVTPQEQPVGAQGRSFTTG